MKFLVQAIKEITAPKTSLIDILRQNLSRPMKARGWGIIHASDLTKDGFCARAVALFEKAKKVHADEWVDMARQSTFDVGHATEDLVREKWLGDRAYGLWRCVRCKKNSELGQKPPVKTYDTPCEHEWRYVEVKFWSPTHQFSGSLDVLADLGAPKLNLVEVKMKDKDEFAKLVIPDPEHRVRTNLYLWLVENSDSPYKDLIDTKHARVLYVSRGFGKKNLQANGEIMPFKEFELDRDDECIQQPLARAAAIVAYRKGAGLPARECKMSFCPQAKGCPVMAQCFSCQDPLPSQKHMVNTGITGA